MSNISIDTACHETQRACAQDRARNGVQPIDSFFIERWPHDVLAGVSWLNVENENSESENSRA